MSRSSPMLSGTRLWRLIFEMQWLHAIALGLLLGGVALATRTSGVRAGELWRLDSTNWLWLAVGLAVAHQTYVWFCWRAELHGRWLSRWFGSRALGAFWLVFAMLAIARLVGVILLARSNCGTIGATPLVLQAVALVILAPAAYVFYSVGRHFGFRRACGADHFDERYRFKPWVREGIFRFTSNGMYVFGFLTFWAVALWFGSAAALVASAFNHLYIWVHYWATERPDMRRIYGRTIPNPAA